MVNESVIEAAPFFITVLLLVAAWLLNLLLEQSFKRDLQGWLSETVTVVPKDPSLDAREVEVGEVVNEYLRKRNLVARFNRDLDASSTALAALVLGSTSIVNLLARGVKCSAASTVAMLLVFTLALYSFVFIFRMTIAEHSNVARRLGGLTVAQAILIVLNVTAGMAFLLL